MARSLVSIAYVSRAAVQVAADETDKKYPGTPFCVWPLCDVDSRKEAPEGQELWHLAPLRLPVWYT